MPTDPVTTVKERADMIVNEIWKVTGVDSHTDSSCLKTIPELTKNILKNIKDHPSIKHVYKSRLWCSQDDVKKKKRKPKEGKNIKHCISKNAWTWYELPY